MYVDLEVRLVSDMANPSPHLARTETSSVARCRVATGASVPSIMNYLTGILMGESVNMVDLLKILAGELEEIDENRFRLRRRTG